MAVVKTAIYAQRNISFGVGFPTARRDQYVDNLPIRRQRDAKSSHPTLSASPLSEILYNRTETMNEENTTGFYSGTTDVGAAWIIAMAVLLVLIVLA